MTETPSNRTRILHTAEKLFRKLGIRSVTMDDIARELGMSKKTLYQEFNNKADIVFAITQLHFESEQRECMAIHVETQDPVQELIELIRWISNMFKEMNPSMIYELQKYYPRCWHLVQQFEREFVLVVVKESLEKGIKAGLFRSDMQPEIIARIRIAQIHNTFDNEVFPHGEFNPSEVMVQGTELFLHGLVTMKGKKLIYKYLNRPEDE